MLPRGSIDWRSPSVLALMAANALVLGGVLVLGWEFGPVLAIYWAESAVVGFFNVLKMLTSRCRDAPKADGMEVVTAAQMRVGKLFLVPFFCVHFGIFMFVHGMFIVAMCVGLGLRGDSGAMMSLAPLFDTVAGGHALAVAALFASHGVSFVRNFILRGERDKVPLPVLMMAPYGRIVVMHLTLLFGMFLTLAIGSSAAIAALFVVIKTAADLRAHGRERRRSTMPEAVAA